MIWHCVLIVVVVLSIADVYLFLRLRRGGSLTARLRRLLLITLLVAFVCGLWLGGYLFSYQLDQDTRFVGFPAPVLVLKHQADGGWRDYLRYAPLLVWTANIVFFVDVLMLLFLSILLRTGRGRSAHSNTLAD